MLQMSLQKSSKLSMIKASDVPQTDRFLSEVLERRVMDGQTCYVIEKTMEVKIYDQNHKTFLRNIMLMDTGSDYNFILRSVVEGLRLDTLQIPPRDLNGFENHQFQVDHAVMPKWQFSQGENIYQEFIFYVLSEIPGGSIVLGINDITRLGIHLIKIGAALVAAEDPEGWF